jgi:hypothetical protein
MRTRLLNTVLFVGIAMAATISAGANAQDAYPNRAVKMVVPYPPGDCRILSPVWLRNEWKRFGSNLL